MKCTLHRENTDKENSRNMGSEYLLSISRLEVIFPYVHDVSNYNQFAFYYLKDESFSFMLGICL